MERLMDIQDVKTAKRSIIVSFSVLCALLAALGIWILWYGNRPVSPQLTVESLEKAMNASAYQVLMADTCLIVEDSVPLSGYCGFDSWKQKKPDSAGTHIMTIRLGEEWELALYEGGSALAYDGYCSSKYRGRVWYQIPESAASELADYFRANGRVQEMGLGPAAWFAVTES